MGVRMIERCRFAPVSPTEKLVLLVLADCHNDETLRCFPGLRRLEAATGLDRRTLQRAVHRLEARGVIQVVRGDGCAASEYVLPTQTYAMPQIERHGKKGSSTNREDEEMPTADANKETGGGVVPSPGGGRVPPGGGVVPSPGAAGCHRGGGVVPSPGAAECHRGGGVVPSPGAAECHRGGGAVPSQGAAECHRGGGAVPPKPEYNQNREPELNLTDSDFVGNQGTKSKSRSKVEKLNSEDPPDPRHAAVMRLWLAAYQEVHEERYVCNGGKDGSALKRFLSLAKDVTPETFIERAKAAWARYKDDRFATKCGHAATLHGLCTFWNDVSRQLKASTPSALLRRPNTRDERGQRAGEITTDVSIDRVRKI